MTKRKQTTTNRVDGNQAAAAPANGNGKGIGEARAMFAALSLLNTRAGVASYLGKSFGGNRDLYEALGYPQYLRFAELMARYDRQDIAKAVIDAPVRACWRKPPTISESEEDETEFEGAWTDLVKRLQVFNYFSRVDRLASIGEYAVLLLGFNDAAQLWQPVKRASQVLYLMPYSQDNAKIERFVEDPKDERFGLPETYTLNMRTGMSAASTVSRKVHWSRVIHVSEDNLDDDTLGIPRLKAIYNRLQDLELVSGSSAEMFWRGAFPGFGLKLDPDFQANDQLFAQMEEEAEEYVHDLRRYMRLKGMSIESIAQQIGDPANQADLYITLISAATRIPKRILLGNEQGELASSQDESNWFSRVDERRRDHCEPKIVRPFVDRCVAVGALPTPAGGYTCEWEDLLTPSEKDKAEVAGLISNAIAAYTSSGADSLMPLKFYLTDVLKFDAAQIERIEEQMGDLNELANGRDEITAPDDSPDDEPVNDREPVAAGGGNAE